MAGLVLKLTFWTFYNLANLLVEKRDLKFGRCLCWTLLQVMIGFAVEELNKFLNIFKANLNYTSEEGVPRSNHD